MKQRAYHYMRVPKYEQREVPDGMFDVAHRRTAYLAGVSLNQPLAYLLASAYLQGINDALSVMDKQSS